MLLARCRLAANYPLTIDLAAAERASPERIRASISPGGSLGTSRPGGSLDTS